MLFEARKAKATEVQSRRDAKYREMEAQSKIEAKGREAERKVQIEAQKEQYALISRETKL